MKIHKKMYKAGKQWLVAAIMTAAAIALTAVPVHADQVTNNQQGNAQQNTVITNSQSTETATLVTNQGQQPDYSKFTPEEQAAIKQAQQAVDQQQQVVSADEQATAQAQAKQDEDQRQYDNAVAQRDQYKSANDQVNDLSQKWSDAFSQETNIKQDSQYLALKNQQESLCPGYWSATTQQKTAMLADLRAKSVADYQKFYQLSDQMDQLINSATEKQQQAYAAWQAAQKSTAYQQYQFLDKQVKQLYKQKNDAFNQLEACRSTETKDKYQLADKTNALTKLLEKALANYQQSGDNLEKAQQAVNTQQQVVDDDQSEVNQAWDKYQRLSQEATKAQSDQAAARTEKEAEQKQVDQLYQKVQAFNERGDFSSPEFIAAYQAWKKASDAQQNSKATQEYNRLTKLVDQLGDQEQEAYQQWQKLDTQLTKDKAALTNLKNRLDELKGGSQQQPSETYTVTVNYVDQNGQQI